MIFKNIYITTSPFDLIFQLYFRSIGRFHNRGRFLSFSGMVEAALLNVLCGLTLQVMTLWTSTT